MKYKYKEKMKFYEKKAECFVKAKWRWINRNLLLDKVSEQLSNT